MTKKQLTNIEILTAVSVHAQNNPGISLTQLLHDASNLLGLNEQDVWPIIKSWTEPTLFPFDIPENRQFAIMVEFNYKLRDMLPTRRHSSPRDEYYKDGEFVVILPWATEEEAPIAIEMNDKRTSKENSIPWVYRWWNGNLYTAADPDDLYVGRDTRYIDVEGYYPRPVRDWADPESGSVLFGLDARYDHDEVRQKLLRFAETSLVIDGHLWQIAPEPVWKVSMGGSSYGCFLKLDPQVNNYGHENWTHFYSLLEFDAALEHLKRYMRLDDEKEPTIFGEAKVYIPEAIRYERQPRRAGEANVIEMPCEVCGGEVVIVKEHVHREYFGIRGGDVSTTNLHGGASQVDFPYTLHLECSKCHASEELTGWTVEEVKIESTNRREHFTVRVYPV